MASVSARDLTAQLLEDGGWCVEHVDAGGTILVRTVLQLDGDVVTRVRRGAELDDRLLEAHWAEVAECTAALSRSLQRRLVAVRVAGRAIVLLAVPLTLGGAARSVEGLVRASAETFGPGVATCILGGSLWRYGAAIARRLLGGRVRAWLGVGGA